MDQLELWKNFSEKLKIVTTDNQWDLPDSPGVYGWFLPFYIYNKDLYKLVDTISNVYLYDSKSKGIPQRDASIEYNWDKLDISISKEKKTNLKENTTKFWNAISKDTDKLDSFANVFLLSSIFAPPLYVGKAKNLKDRYYQHIDGYGKEKNTFNTRFTNRMKELNITLTVRDLLFLCIPLTRCQNDIMKQDESEKAIEDILMSIVKPNYSDR